MVVGLWLAAAGSGVGLEIFRPNFGVPEILEPGGSFRVEVTAPAGLSTSGWSVVLFNDLRAWSNAVVRQVQYGPHVYNNTVAGYALTVETPSSLPPELFGLLVRHTTGGAETNERCVSLVPCLETNFYFLHYADLQASASNALSANGANTPYGSIQEIYWHTEVLNLIHPRFMFNTGDELDDGDVDTVQRYRQYQTAMNTLQVPHMITRGNNDRGSFGHWKTNFGQAAFSLRMGSFYVGMNDTQSGEMSAWFTNDVAASFTNGHVAYRLVGQHFNSSDRNPFFYTPQTGYEPHLMLVGHNHTFATLQTSPCRVLSSGPAYHYGAVALFSFSKSGGVWNCAGVSNHPAATRFYSVGDWGAPSVACAYEAPNDGMSLSNTATITNSLAFDFPDGRVRFLMRRAVGGYVMTGGIVLAQYDYGSSNAAVLAQVNIRAGRLTPVTVIRADTDEDAMPDAWEMACFGGLGTASEESDFDQDSLLDVEEYLAGSDPTNRWSRFCVSGDFQTPGMFLLNWSGLSNREYAISRSTNLLEGSAAFIGLTNLGGEAGGMTFTDTWDSIGQAFYRIGVSLEE